MTDLIYFFAQMLGSDFFTQVIVFTLLGIAAGVFTGLAPGIHVNMVAAVLLGFAGLADPICLAVMLIAVAITHTFWDFIPSIFLGMPDPETALSVLPGHKLLMEGRGLEAIYLTTIGGVGVMLASALLLPLLIMAVPWLYAQITAYIAYILIAIAVSMVLTEPGYRKKAWASLCFGLSGALGVIVLGSAMLKPQASFFPMFTGLFGVSTLLLSLNAGAKMPEQIKQLPHVRPRLAVSGISKALFSGVLVGTLPGLGEAQATTLTQQITRKRDHEEFLVSSGGINTAVALFSLISLYTISKARSGAAVAVEQMIGSFGINELMMLLGVALAAAGISSLLLLRTMRSAARLLQRANYRLMTMSILAILIVAVAVFMQAPGLLILFASTSMGLLAPLAGVRRSTLMGCLLVPTILIYLGINLGI